MWRHLVTKIGTYERGTTWWPKFEPIQVAPPGDPIWNQWKWCHLEAKFGKGANGQIFIFWLLLTMFKKAVLTNWSLLCRETPGVCGPWGSGEGLWITAAVLPPGIFFCSFFIQIESKEVQNLFFLFEQNVSTHYQMLWVIQNCAAWTSVAKINTLQVGGEIDQVT